MSWIEDRYYKVNSTMLKVIGAWPYHRTKWCSVKAVILSSLFTSFIFVQVAVFMTHEITMELIVNILSLAFPSTFMLFLYFIYYSNADSVFREIIQRMHQHWESLSDTMELAIMADYAILAKLISHVVYSITVFVDCTAILIHAVPMTLDIVMPLNESRANTIHIMTEYFVDPSKYFLPIIVHVLASICIGGLTAATSSLAFMNYGLHACALFKVANYRMGIVMDETVLQISSTKGEYMIHKRIIHAVTFHRTAMQFCNFMVTELSKSFGVLLVTGVVSTSITLFRFLNALMYMDNFVELIISNTLVFAHFCFLFFANHVGQQISDNNSDIFDTAYNLPWYVASRNTKQLLLLILLRGNKKYYVSLSSLFNASYEGFATLTTSSISYFTVLYSLLQ